MVLDVRRAGAILAVSDFASSVAFYRDQLGFEVEAIYDDPPYATLTRAGTRLSLAEQGHPADDRPGVAMVAPTRPLRARRDPRARGRGLPGRVPRARRHGVQFLAEPFSPPWGGHRCFAIDPDGNLIELEEPA